jgi:hypothetical protein
VYIDSLTITALVIFVVSLVVFVRFCMMTVCGMRSTKRKHDSHKAPRANGS